MDKEEIIKAAAGSGFLVLLIKKIFGRKKDRDNFWKLRFEGAQQIVSFWEEKGKKLIADMLALDKKYQDLSKKYDGLYEKYGVVIAQNFSLQNEVAQLRLEVKTLKGNATV